MTDTATTVPEAVPVRLKAPLLGVVCRKCVKRIGGDPDKAAKQITRALREQLGSKAQAAGVGCLKLCPKRRVVVVPQGGPAYVVPAATWRSAATALLAARATPRR